MGMRDSLSGYDLARSGDRLLWLVPGAMLIILAIGLPRVVGDKTPSMIALAMTVGGAISAYVMYRERASIDHSPELIATQWTIFFWLAFLACLGVVAGGFAFYFRRSRSP